MNALLLLWPLLAILVFWGVGMRNRVLRLRLRAQESFAELERQISACATLIRVQETVPAWPAPLQALQLQTLQMEAACKSVRQAHLGLTAVAQLRAQLQLLEQQWQAVQQAPADLAGPPVPESLQQQWEAVQRKVGMASAAYNQLAGQYNEALQQHPARWAVRLMGLHAAGLV